MSGQEQRRRVRILFIVRFDSGGTVWSLWELVRHLDQDLFEPVILFYRESGWCAKFRAAGIRVIVADPEIPVRPARSGARATSGSDLRSRNRRHPLRGQISRLVRKDLPVAHRLSAIIREERADLVSHNDNLRAHRAAILGAAMARRPQVCHTRSLTQYSVPLDRLLGFLVNRFVYISTAVETQCREQLGLKPGRGRVIYDPVDLESFVRAAAESGKARRSLGIADGEILVTSVGRLVPGKGHDVFLRALASVRDSHPSVRSVIVGAADPDAGGSSYRDELVRLAAGSKLSGKVHFLGNRDDVPLILAASDIFVHSATQPEGLGRVIVEALAAGCPVVGARTGGVPDVLIDGVTGRLVPAGDVEALADAIRDLIDRPDAASIMAAEGRVRVLDMFGLGQHTRSMQELYASVLQGQGSSALLC